MLGKKYSELNPAYSPELPDRYGELNENRQMTFQYYLEKTQTHLTVIATHSKTKGCVDVFCVDNTELVLTQQMLKSTNHKLSSALDAADMTPWKWDLQTGHVQCQQRLVRHGRGGDARRRLDHHPHLHLLLENLR